MHASKLPKLYCPPNIFNTIILYHLCQYSQKVTSSGGNRKERLRMLCPATNYFKITSVLKDFMQSMLCLNIHFHTKCTKPLRGCAVACKQDRCCCILKDS